MQAIQTQDSTILCKSGTYFDIINPNTEQIMILDIVTALSRICRFGGHCDKFYSVAQHSLHVSYAVPPQYALEGLLHDAAEAYIGDLVAPLKQFLPDYKRIEHNIEAVIAQKFALNTSPACFDAIKEADLRMLLTEKRDLFHGENTNWAVNNPALYNLKPLTERINPVNSARASELFMVRFNKLIDNRS
jgi:5'-deoxynucleotidase YfbR-like HD superfamily hydrolase